MDKITSENYNITPTAYRRSFQSKTNPATLSLCGNAASRPFLPKHYSLAVTLNSPTINLLPAPVADSNVRLFHLLFDGYWRPVNAFVCFANGIFSCSPCRIFFVIAFNLLTSPVSLFICLYTILAESVQDVCFNFVKRSRLFLSPSTACITMLIPRDLTIQCVI